MALAKAEDLHDPEHILTCAICRGRFLKPKELPCLHTFCRDCLEQHVGGKNTFSCPSCHRVTDVPGTGVDGFLNNRHINSLVQLNELFSGGVSHPACQFCASKEPATSWCQDCSSFLCKNCHDRATQMFQGVRFYTLEESYDPKCRAKYRQSACGDSCDISAKMDCLCLTRKCRDSDDDVPDRKVTDVTTGMDTSDARLSE